MALFFPKFLARFHPEMALFRDLSDNLRKSLCDIYASSQFLDFINPAKILITELETEATALVPDYHFRTGMSLLITTPDHDFV